MIEKYIFCLYKFFYRLYLRHSNCILKGFVFVAESLYFRFCSEDADDIKYFWSSLNVKPKRTTNIY